MRLTHYLFLIAFTAGGCSSSNEAPGGPDLARGSSTDLAGSSTDLAGSSTDLAGSSTDLATSSSGLTVITILLENHDYAEVVGNTTKAPYINSLINQYGLARKYYDSKVHPSLPNYLYLISGSTQSQTSDVSAMSTTFAGDNLGNQLQVANIPWRSYQESMGAACNLTDSGNYATKHDPFLYFDNIQKAPNNLCAQTNVDYGQFATDLAAGTYRYMWITPNLVSDGHGGPFPIPFVDDPVVDLTTSDTWCSTEIKKITDSPAFQAGNILIFLTWDEAEGRNGDDADQIPMIIIKPNLKKQTSDVVYSHASYLATVEDLFGLPRLGDAVGAPTLNEFFK